MTGRRIRIPPKTAAQVLVLADRTCCVCKEPRRELQIHHIDEDPSNNDLDNLVALCLHCHNETQIGGGFGRRLDAEQIKLFRRRWHETVESSPSRPSVASTPISLEDQGLDHQGLLRRLVREGTELMTEALFEGHEDGRAFANRGADASAMSLKDCREREKVWTQAAETALAGTPAGLEFAETHAIPSVRFYSIHNRVEARVKILRAALASVETSTEEAPRHRLTQAVEEGMQLRSSQAIKSDGLVPFGEDELFQWACRSYDLLRRHFVLFADDFYGEDPSLGPAHFALAFTFATQDIGRGPYLESRIARLKDALAS